MTTHDDDRSGNDGVYQSQPTDHRGRRRKQLVVGVASAAVVLGAGAYLVTSAIVSENSTGTRDTGAIGPIVAATTGSPAASASASAAPTSSTKAAAKPASSASAVVSAPVSVEERIKRAREAAAKDGHPVQHPVTPKAGVAAAGVGEVKQSNRKTSEGTLRVVTAPYDLTGQRELVWAADEGKKVGDARCTQNFRLSNESAAKERPMLLLCWRTSAKKSVITVAVANKGRPSTASSLAVLNREWAKL